MKSYSKVFLDHQGKATDKWSSYLDVYDAISRDFQPKRILEIGIQNGGSLEVLGKVFPDSEIVIGVDIDENCKKLSFSQSKIFVVLGDIKSKDTKYQIQDLSKNLDLIIDDGSHKSSDIIHALITYLPLLGTGGKYIIEDLHASYWRSWEGGLFEGKSAISFLKRLADVVNFEHWDELVTAGEYLSKLHDISDAFLISLKKIKRITFENSICIIELVEDGKNASLGLRVVTGSEAIVDPTALSRRGMDKSNLVEKCELVNENKNAYLDPDSVRHLLEINGYLKAEIDVLKVERDALVRSWSWRITEPARRFIGLFR